MAYARLVSNLPKDLRGWSEVSIRYPRTAVRMEILAWIAENGRDLWTHTTWGAAAERRMLVMFRDRVDAVFFKLRWYDG